MTDLSPAAQAVLSAADSAHDEWDLRPALAAALRAAADQVVPEPCQPHDSCCEVRSAGERIQLLAIAAELDDAQPNPNPYAEVVDFYDALAAQHAQAVYHHD